MWVKVWGFFGLILLFSAAIFYDSWHTHTGGDLGAAPEEAFTTLEGQQYSSFQALEEPAIIVNFWATWCTPCLVELPSLLERVQEGKGRLALVAVSTDKSAAIVEEFLARWPGADAPHIYWVWDEGGRLAQAFGTVKVPESYILNAQRRLTRKVVGAYDWARADGLF
jgi:thiol-disulfide isomerase/thioredoxin